MSDPPPLLGVIVDRSSFDETEDYDVDVEWDDTGSQSATVLKSGKVRRRLRWRPRVPRPHHHNDNASVGSQFSKRSSKSLHSFASTATEKQNNKRNKQRFPRPRMMRPAPSKATIGNEGDWIQAKMQGTVFEAADQSETESSPTIKRPPLFGGIRKSASSASMRSAAAPSLRSVPSTASARSTTSARSTASARSVVRTSASAQSFDCESPVTLPEMEPARQVDLRIPTKRVQSTLSEISVEELRPAASMPVDGTPTSHSIPASSSMPLAFHQQAPYRESLERVLEPTTEEEDDDQEQQDEESSEQRFSMDLSFDEDPSLTTAAAEKNLQAIHTMALEHLQHHEYAEALEVFEEILRGQLARYGMQHARIGTALHNVAIVHLKCGDFERAIQVCKDAVQVRRMVLGESHSDVAVSLAQLGVAYLESRKFKKAVVAFREALRIRRECYGPSHPKVAKILNNIGCALYELNELDVAKVAFEEALDVQRENLKSDCLVEEGPQLLSIASTLCNVASIKLYWGQQEEAMIDLEEALLLQQSVLGDDHPVTMRTEESLEWVARAQGKEAEEDDRSPEIVPAASSGILSWTAGITMLDETKENTGLLLCTGSQDMEKPAPKSGVLEELERRFYSWQETLDVTCGGDDQGSVGNRSF